MPTIQSADPNERVDHPRHYNAHPSDIECIELIEHLSLNLGNAVKYVWRCGLKATETPLRDLKSAKWYVEREIERIGLYDLDTDAKPRTDILWRGLARKVTAAGSGVLEDCLDHLLHDDFDMMIERIDHAIEELEARPSEG